jgi:DNA-binding GntR family transcriptional regulator
MYNGLEGSSRNARGGDRLTPGTAFDQNGGHQMIKAKAQAMALPKLKQRVLSQQVLIALRSAILEGRLPPGHHLVEADVAEQMDISRAPVREAIKRLDQEGLVEFFPHRGSVVVGMSEDEIDAIYELRAAIEARAIAQACERITNEDLSRMRALLTTMAEQVDRGAIDGATGSDLTFHRTIVEASGYTVLKRLWDSLDGIVRVRSMQALERPGAVSRYFLRNSVASHDALLRALTDRDVRRATRLAREHILEVASHIRGKRKGSAR